jgi:hypothetical protein
MRKRIRIAVGALALTMALAAAVSAASARRITFSEQQFLILFRNLSYQPPGEGFKAVCDINLEGSFHSRTISKVSGQLIGYITEAAVHHPCPVGESFMLNGTERSPDTLPWRIAYKSFGGTLPNIAIVEVLVTGYHFVIEVFGAACLYDAPATNPVPGILNVGEGRLTTFRFNEGSTFPRLEGGGLCPTAIGAAGSGTIGARGTWSAVSVRLVP